MRFDVITVFPQLILDGLAYGVVGQAIKAGRIQLHTQNPRDYVHDVHKTIDDRPFGGSDGMLMLAEPLEACLTTVGQQVSHLPTEKRRTIYLSPRGQVLTDRLARTFSGLEQITLLCGRYAGVDQRFLASWVDDEVSIGDYVLSGGELAAQVLIDAVARFRTGVLGNEASPQAESFADGLLEAPQFTRPREYRGMQVPEVLTSGHHARIQLWRRLLSILVTAERRPDLLNLATVSDREIKKAQDLLTSMPEAERLVCGLSSPELIQERLNARIQTKTHSRSLM